MVIKRTPLCIIGLVFVCCALRSEPVHGATYYVATNGQDTNSCAQAQSQSAPKLTLNNAIACLSAGDTLLVRGGTYVEQLYNNIPSGTSWSNKTRIAVYPGETAWIRPNGDVSGQSSIITLSSPGTFRYIEFDGINVDGRGFPFGYSVQSVHLECSRPGTGADHIRFQNLESIGAPGANVFPGGPTHFGMFSVDGCPGGGNEFINLKVHGGGEAGGFAYAFYVGMGNVLIDGCELYNLSGFAMQLYSGTVSYNLPGIVVRNNKIHDITRSHDTRMIGIIVGNSIGAKIYNNVIYNIGTGIPSVEGGGIYDWIGLNTEIYNNTVYGNNGNLGGINVSSKGAIVRNNISYNNTGGDYQDSGSGTIASNNLFSIHLPR
jgi:hypothetical protein